jgi:hypothetical protein
MAPATRCHCELNLDIRAVASSVSAVVEDRLELPVVLALVFPRLALDEEEEGTRDEIVRLGLEEVERDDLLLDPDFFLPEDAFDFLLFAIIDLQR